MSPQPAAAPKATSQTNGDSEAAQTAAALHAELLKRIDDTDPEDRTSGEKQIARAIRLENERAETMKRIAANREYLRLMEENEELEDDEADWLADFYPQKEKGQVRSDDEIERTRKVKAAARKGK